MGFENFQLVQKNGKTPWISKKHLLNEKLHTEKNKSRTQRREAGELKKLNSRRTRRTSKQYLKQEFRKIET